MKIHACLAVALMTVPLCTADIFSPTITTGIDYALVGASIADGNYIGPAVIALSECDCPGINFATPYEFTILNSGMHINSPYFLAFDQSGNADLNIIANYINAVGGIAHDYDWPEDVYVHDETYNIPPEPDPYAYLPPHDPTYYTSLPDIGTISTSGTYSPGYYSGGIQVTDPSVTITLEPGDYYLDSIGQSASMEVNGGSIVGEGVTLHIVGEADKGIEIQGNANIDISAPTYEPYMGVCIFQKRNPNYDCIQSCTHPWYQAFPHSEFLGAGEIFIDGAVYMPHNRLELGGNGDIFLTRVVADRFLISGIGQKIIGYDGTDYIPGDLIKNGIVDIDDLIFFCMQWGAENPLSDMYYIESNLNYDINLDLQDFAILSSHWLSDTVPVP